MESLGNLTNAPLDFDCNGQNLKLYGLRLTDWGEVEQWMRSQIIGAAIEAVTSQPKIAPDFRQNIMEAAHLAASRISIGQCFLSAAQSEEEITKTMSFMRTFDGMLRVVRLSLRDKPGKDGTPLFELKDVSELFDRDNNALIEAFGLVMDLSFPKQNRDGEVTEEPKNLMTKNQ